MPTGQFATPQPNKLIQAMQQLANKTPVTAINRLYVAAPQHYLGTYIGAEVLDANLAIVRLQGGSTARFIPTLAGLSLIAGDVVKLEKSSALPLHIVGKLVGNISLALSSETNVPIPGSPTSLHSTGTTTSSISLAWTPGADHFGAGLSYSVFMNGKFKQNTTVGHASATISGLIAGTAYKFYVTATDGVGNVSKPSTEISVTTGGTAPIPPGTTLTKTYKPTSCHSYNYTGHGEIDHQFDNSLYQGDNQVGGWNQVSFMFFNYAAIQADLAGNTIKACTISLTYAHWYEKAGGTAIVGTHNYTSVPSSQTTATYHLNMARGSSTVGKKITLSLGTTGGNYFKSGEARGIIVGPALTSGGSTSQSPVYYGHAYGIGTYTPVLSITYTTPS